MIGDQFDAGSEEDSSDRELFGQQLWESSSTLNSISVADSGPSAGKPSKNSL